MRRADREVTDACEIAGIMSRCEVLRIAMNTDTVPYLLPVNFGMEPDGMTLYIHGAMDGTKYGLITRDNRVSFEMDCVHGLLPDEKAHNCSMDYESVIGWGYIDELTAEDDKRHALERIMTQYHSENFSFDNRAISFTRLLRLRVEARTGKRRKKMPQDERKC